jgi:hypothetical protein
VGRAVGVEQLGSEPQPAARAVVAGSEPQPQLAVELVGELAGAIATADARRGELQVPVAGVVGVGAHLLGQLVEALHVVGHPVLRAVLARRVLGQEPGERRDRGGGEAGGARVCVPGVAGERPVEPRSVMSGVL